MPRQGRFKSQEMSSLARQLSFVPSAVAKRQLTAVRGMLEAIRPDDLVKWSGVVRAITQFPLERRTGGPEPEIVGAALLSDLREFSLRLSRRAPVPHNEALTLAVLAKKWNVSLRTIHRFRRDGLQCCWMESGRGPKGSLAVGVRNIDAASFAALQGARIPSVRRARRPSGTRVASVKRKSSPRARAVALAMWRRGEGSSAVARRLGLSTSAADRLLCTARTQALRQLAPTLLPDSCEIPATFHRADARSVLLAPQSVHESLVPLWGPPEKASADPSDPQTPAAATKAANTQLIACRFLLHGVAQAAQALPPRGGTTGVRIDRLETDLRWASALLRTLLIGTTPEVSARVKVLTAKMPVPARAWAQSESMAMAARVLIGLLAAAPADQLATGRVRIGQLIALGVERQLAAEIDTRAASVGGRRLRTRDELARICPWIRSVDTSETRAAQLVEGRSAAHWTLRLGAAGNPPMTIGEIAQSMGFAPRRVAMEMATSARRRNRQVRR